MLFNDAFMMDISRIEIAHEFVLDKDHVCEYPNGRGTYGMVYCVEGEAEYRFNSGERLTVGEGDTLFLSPNTAYSIFTRKEFRHYTVNFRIHKKSSRLDIIDKPYCVLKSVNSEQLERQFNKLTVAWMQKSVGYEMMSVSYLYSLAYLFYFNYRNLTVSTSYFTRLVPAKEHIDQRFASRITLEQLARLCDMSVTNFRREWLKAYGITPMRYRDEIRLSYAKQYLVSGYYSVAEVAERCGFDDAGYFIRFFEKHVGVSPGAFKRQALAGI